MKTFVQDGLLVIVEEVQVFIQSHGLQVQYVVKKYGIENNLFVKVSDEITDTPPCFIQKKIND